MELNFVKSSSSNRPAHFRLTFVSAVESKLPVVGSVSAKNTTSAKSEWVLRTTGENAMQFTFSDVPTKREGSNVYYFLYTFKDPLNGKYRHSKISSGVTDYRRAKGLRDELREAALAKISSNRVQFTDKQPLGVFFNSFLLAKENEGRSKKTLYDYRLRLQHFTNWADPALPICNITRDQLRLYFGQMSSQSTKSLAFRTLNAAFNWGVGEEKLERNPLNRIKLTKPNERKRDYLSEQEFKRLYERMPERTYVERSAKFASLFALATGARLGEICHIKVKNINWDRSELTITNSEIFQTKNKCERTLPVTPRVKQALLEQLRNKASHQKEDVRDSPYLFVGERGRPYTNEQDKSCHLSRLFAELRSEVMPDREGIHFHSLRHSFGQNAYNAGIPLVEISKIMGHKNVAVTARYYTKQSDYENMGLIHKYLDDQPVMGIAPIPSLEEQYEPILGNLTTKQLTECVHSD